MTIIYRWPVTYYVEYTFKEHIHINNLPSGKNMFTSFSDIDPFNSTLSKSTVVSTGIVKASWSVFLRKFIVIVEDGKDSCERHEKHWVFTTAAI